MAVIQPQKETSERRSSPVPASSERVYVIKPSGERVEVEHVPGRLLLALDRWLHDLVADVNGGYGEIWIEVAEGEIKRVKPAESWLVARL